MIRTLIYRCIAYLASAFHPLTIARAFGAVGIGVYTVLRVTFDYCGAKDLTELRLQNPTKHAEVQNRRRFWVLAAILLDLIGAVVLQVYVTKATGRNQGFIAWFLVHLVIVFFIGRKGPIMARVQTTRLVGEALIRSIVNDITLTPAQIKLEYSSQIVSPVQRLPSHTGYEVLVRIHDKGDALKLDAGPQKVAQKLHKDKATVFVYRVTVAKDESVRRLVILDSDPFDAPATSNPLVLQPRPFNIWRERAPLGTNPDGTVYDRFMTAEGDGGGALVGGAPRMGKTIAIKDLLVPILLHGGSQIHMIDGKAVAFGAIRPLCATFVGADNMEDLELILGAIAALVKIKDEIGRRKSIFIAEEVEHITEALAAKHRMFLHWIVIDELAAFTEDMKTLLPKEVARFMDLLMWLVRIGPAFGVYCILATQRPSDKSIPESLRGLIIFKTAFYVSTQPSSAAITGKAGPENRADFLDPDQKGVGIVVGNGPVRWHMIDPMGFKRVAAYAATIRDSVGDQPEPEGEYPEPIKSILIAFENHGTDRLPSTVICRELGEEWDPTTLASALRPYGISRTDIKHLGKTRKGYHKHSFTRVTKRATKGVNGGQQAATTAPGRPPVAPPELPPTATAARTDPKDLM